MHHNGQVEVNKETTNNKFLQCYQCRSRCFGSKISEVLLPKTNQAMTRIYIRNNVRHFACQQLRNFVSYFRRYSQHNTKKILCSFRKRTCQWQRKEKIQNKRIVKELKSIIRTLLGLEISRQQSQDAGSGRIYKRCHICGESKAKKIKTTCHKCRKHACKDHSELFIKRSECLER